jgi:ubiquinone/menaquinone biosynthesis C-methylase UbiE
MQRRLLGTKLEEKYWARAHLRRGDDWGDKENDWARGYWDSRDHSHRSFLIDRISRFSPSSVLEIGSNCGPNLYILAKRFPNAELMGVDINSEAVQKGNEWFAQEHISNVKLTEGKADDLRLFQDKSFDVVFTDAVLIYVGPDKIRQVITEMLRVTRKALILLEWHDFDSSSTPLGTYVGHWMRDYVALLKELVPEEEIRVSKLPRELWADPKWQKWGAVIETVV